MVLELTGRRCSPHGQSHRPAPDTSRRPDFAANPAMMRPKSESQVETSCHVPFVFVRCSLLGRLFALLRLLLASLDGSSLLDAVKLLDHEGASDPKTRHGLEIALWANGGKYLPVPDLGVGEHATVRTADGPGGAAGPLEVSGTHGLDAGHLGTLSLLFDVLNRELATRGLHLSEAVRLGPV